MISRRTVAVGAVIAGLFVAAVWQDAFAQQPRDPKPGVARSASTREGELKAATAADPSNAANWIELAKLQEERAAFDEAEAALISAVKASRGSREVLITMAGFYNRTGNFEKTMSTLETAAAADPADPAGHQLVATYYWEKAQRDQRLTPVEKLTYVDAGIAATDRALAQKEDYIEALTYKNVLLRMKANVETDEGRRGQLLAEADALRSRAMELAKTRGSAASVPPWIPPPAPAPPPPPPSSLEVTIDGQQAVRIGGDIRPPTKIADARPEYPPEAMAARVTGMVILEAVIDTQGLVRSARVLRSIPLLDQAALDAVQQWRFTPTLRDGVPVPVVMTVTVNFSLQ